MSDRLATHIEAALSRGGRDDLNALVALLEGELLTHARAERDHFYPVVDELVRAHGRATATMDIDHEFITERVGVVAQAVERLRAATPGAARVEAKRALRDALMRLEALLDVHMAKEERVYLPLVERHLSPEARRALDARMDEAAAPDHREPEMLDARKIPQQTRHDEIFAALDRLPVGASLVLVVDHDPRPLAYEITRRYSPPLTFDYLERGPLWRVRITRPVRA